MHCLAISHKTASASIRALFAFSENEKRNFLHQLVDQEIVSECVLLTTCNRTELYFIGDRHVVTKVQQALVSFKQVTMEEWMKYFQVYLNDKAMKHLYKVACGIDSMVLGEDQILGQIKEAYSFAREEGITGFYLNTIFKDAITCAKRVKTDTNLSKLSVSVATLAANEVFRFQKEDSTDKKVLIIGVSGKMGTIVMKNINNTPGITVYGTLRKHNASIQILEPGVVPVDYEKRYESMDQADIIISVTSSPHYTITKEALSKVLVTGKKRLFLDLSVPMDIDKEIEKLPMVILHDIDHFEYLSQENNRMKLQEVESAEEIVEDFMEEVKKTILFHEFLEHMPHVKETFAAQSFESILYQLRDQSRSNEFYTFLELLKQL